MTPQRLVFTGYIISPKSLHHIEVLNGFITVENGKITNLGNKTQYEDLKSTGHFNNFTSVDLDKTKFLMPGFIDCHTHAPQFPNLGLGLDRPLLEWLDKYTFPLEKQYGDAAFAKKVYGEVVKRLLRNGTTTACYFGSLHLNGTMELVSAVLRYHQRALVGKVSMNLRNDAGYYNNTEEEIEDVKKFLKYVDSFKNDLIQPVVTPRFAVSVDRVLMTHLAQLAKEHDCMVQSHISENKGEIDHVLQINPGFTSYADVYDDSNILNNKCIMAHAVHLTEHEMLKLSERGVSIAHCPASNTRLMSGLCPLTKILSHGIRAGLGTDVSGGDNATILDAMRRCMDVSSHLQLKGEAKEVIAWREAIFLATLGGAQALNLDSKTGSLEIGKEFDALVVSVYEKGGPIDYYGYSVDTTEQEVAESLLQRFVFLGDDRNIVKVYVKGVEVKSTL